MACLVDIHPSFPALTAFSGSELLYLLSIYRNKKKYDVQYVHQDAAFLLYDRSNTYAIKVIFQG
jgi:hypothetical protein